MSGALKKNLVSWPKNEILNCKCFDRWASRMVSNRSKFRVAIGSLSSYDLKNLNFFSSRTAYLSSHKPVKDGHHSNKVPLIGFNFLLESGMPATI